MNPCVILLQIHLLTALCDPFGLCYDRVSSVAVRIAEGGRKGGGPEGREPPPVRPSVNRSLYSLELIFQTPP